MRGATLCSGIGAPETALPHWDWLWCAEVEPFPSRVLAARHPSSVNLGDITADDFVDRAIAVGIPDVLVAGTPCQAFSIAGLRGGLHDDRGNLTLRALEIYDALCDAARLAGRREPILWWENVPGILSDRTGAFGCLLSGLAGSEAPLVPPKGCGWTNAGLVAGPRRVIAWRVLDAQFFGLAQRRERVFLVASPGDGPDPAAVLFEPASLHGNPASRRETWKGVAPTLSARTKGGGGLGTGGAHETDFLAVTHALRAEGFDASEDGTGRGTPIVPVSVALRGRDGGGSIELGDDLAYALRSSQGGGDKPHVLAFSAKDSGADAQLDLSPTLHAGGHYASHANGGVMPAIQYGMAVRRLTPRECERLQGFPDDFSLLPQQARKSVEDDYFAYLTATYPDMTRDEAERLSKDGARYKVLGNSMAVPCIAWLGRRIEEAGRAALLDDAA